MLLLGLAWAFIPAQRPVCDLFMVPNDFSDDEVEELLGEGRVQALTGSDSKIPQVRAGFASGETSPSGTPGAL